MTYVQEQIDAYLYLRRKIINDDLKAGTAICEQKIADELRINQSSVQEAIKRLTLEGLLKTVPEKDVIVCQLTANDLREIHEMRLLLEEQAICMAIARGNHSKLAGLAARLNNLRDASTFDVEEAQMLGWLTHEYLFEAANNTRLHRMYHCLRTQSGLAMQALPRYNVDRSRATVDEHLAIILAVLAGDEKGAKTLLREHLSAANKTRLEILS